MSGLRGWWVRRKERREREAFNRGFDWASGEMNRGRSPDWVAQEMAAGFFFDPTAFDYGAKAAIEAWRGRQVLAQGETYRLRYAPGCSCGC